MAREDELIREIHNGRRECLDELIALYYPAILRYCLWHMPDRESALDATQETFLKLIRFIHRYDHKGQFRAFLYRIASNTCIDMLRRSPAAEPLTEELSQTAGVSDAAYETIEKRQQLTAMLTCLDSETRELVLLKYGQELTLREIASITGMPLRTIQTKLRRALAKMQQHSPDRPV